MVKKKSFFHTLSAQWQLAVLSVPFLLYVLFNNYLPLWGWTYSFFEAHQRTMLPNFERFLGLSMFVKVFETPKFWLVLRNTFAISFLKLTLNFIGAISLAVMINELRVKWFKKTVQTISYLPHFVSWVVAVSLITVALSTDGGMVNNILMSLGIIKKPVNFIMMNGPGIWLVIALSELWKTIGWNSIIYLAAIAGIDQEMYEAAQIDGAGRLRKIISITIPCITPTIKILMTLSVGSVLSAGFEQLLLMQRPITLDFSEVLDTYTYKIVWGSSNPGRMYRDIPFATAIGMMNSIVSFTLVVIANKIAYVMDGERLF